MPSRALGVAFVAAVLLALPVSGARAEVTFDGVAAGDPSAGEVILWTRAENGGAPIELKAQIATDPNSPTLSRPAQAPQALPLTSR